MHLLAMMARRVLTRAACTDHADLASVSSTHLARMCLGPPRQHRHTCSLLDSACRGVVGKRTVLENLDLVLIAIDETVDDGCALPVLCLLYTSPSPRD